MKTSDQINEITKSLSLAQGEMRPATKDCVNPHFKSRYASMSSVWESIREPLSKNSLAIWQDIQTIPEGITISTRLSHVSGQWIECGPLFIPLTKKDAQGIGSAITYAKRYSLSALLGVVADEDDDANEAQKQAPEAVKPKQKDQSIALASSEEISKIYDLISQFINPQETMNRVLLAAKIQKLDDMPESRCKGAINWLEQELKKTQQS